MSSPEYPRMAKLAISDIHVDTDTNPRDVNESVVVKLKGSMEKFGNLQPIVVNARTQRLLGGHQRLKALVELGEESVDVWEVDLDEFAEKAASIALNNEVGEYDFDAVGSILKDLDSDQIALTCFDDDEITRFMTELDESFVEGTEAISEKMEMHKITLQFSSLEEKFRWENFIELCKMKAKHDRPVTDYMFELMEEVDDS